ncbi:MAG: hypothetical protein HY259_00400 [Chloroflexi bacterium]|nr:hypothetical protein [Chloroflexota bacterium]MBI3731913.1 hypothetical protein [Chloroflexota bacterium]
MNTLTMQMSAAAPILPERQAAECVSNIGAREQRKRLRFGAAMLVISLALLVTLLATGAERGWRVGLFLPFAAAAIGFFQARDKT